MPVLKNVKIKQEQKANHLIVNALAGCGKTFTEIVGTVAAFRPELMEFLSERLGFEITPSEEQEIIFSKMGLTKDVKSVTYCAFNKSIVTAFAEEWGFLQEELQLSDLNFRFATVNSLGNGVCSQAFGRVKPTNNRGKHILEAITQKKWRELIRKDEVLANGILQLYNLCKLTLTGWTEEEGFDPNIPDKDFHKICTHYGIDLQPNWDRGFNLCREMLRRSLQVTTEIDFNDQNWLPVVKNLPVAKADFLMVDEGQDLPRCKQEFARMAGHNVMLVGDINQAIYGFAGADVDSIPRMTELLGVDGALTLTETRRCSVAVTKEANRALVEACLMRGEEPIVLRAHKDNLQGKVLEDTLSRYGDKVKDGDMVLSRVTAPLVSQGMAFLKEGRKVVIRGREFGLELVNFIKKFKAKTVEELIEAVEGWYIAEVNKENAKRDPSDTRLQNLMDKRDCVLTFTEEADSIDSIISHIHMLFSGKQCPSCKKQFLESQTYCPNKSCETDEVDMSTGFPRGPKLVTPDGILFSTVHRAKGLEADNVFLLLKNAPIPHPMAKLHWEIVQEWNCKYIAITRAKDTFTYVL